MLLAPLFAVAALPLGPTDQVIWMEQPTPAQVAGAYPAKAQRSLAAGQGVIDCIASADGGLADCVIQAETPAGMGFGAAALRLAPHFKLHPVSRQGRSVRGAKLTVTVDFRKKEGLPQY